MPSFAFWKSAKREETSPLLSDAEVKEELSIIIPSAKGAVDLDPGSQDAGVFLFDEDAQEIAGDQTPVVEPDAQPLEQLPRKLAETAQQVKAVEIEASLLDVCEPLPCPDSPALLPEPLCHDNVDLTKGAPLLKKTDPAPAEEQVTTIESSHNSREEPSPPKEPPSESGEEKHPQSRPVSQMPKEFGPTLSVEKRTMPVALAKVETNIRDRDSGVFLSDTETSPARSRPSSIVSTDNSPLRPRVASLSKASASPRTKSIARLQRPAELNLGFTAPDTAKPKSELDLRYDLIRNSKTQSKAALRSPTQLLQDRLNMSPKKKDTEERVRVFTPPRVTANGCLLPGPGAHAEAFTSTSVRARTEAGARPAWWCKFDKLVVFDGIEHVDGELKLRTRTSKGLTIARRRGDLETVVIPLDCAHCHEMLNRHEWKYDIRVCKRSVCWDCKERCKWEFEQEKTTVATPRAEANRERADSMLQDEQDRNSELKREIVA